MFTKQMERRKQGKGDGVEKINEDETTVQTRVEEFVKEKRGEMTIGEKD